MNIRSLNVALFMSMVFMLTACVDSTYTITTPANGAKYAGLDGQAAPSGSTPTLPQMLRIAYTDNPGELKVYLNGQQVGNRMTFTPTYAEVEFSQIKDFLKQGANTVVVEPFKFGPVHVFNYDSKGPSIVITNVNRSGGNATVEGYVTDASQVSSLVLNTYNYAVAGGTDSEGNPKGTKTGGVLNSANVNFAAGTREFQLVVPEANVYSFIGTDAYGYTTTHEYLSTDQTINPVFKMRVSNVLLETVKPLANAQGDNQAMWSNYAGNLRGKSMPAGFSDNIVLNTINENHSAIYTDIGAANGNANNCHERPLVFTCNSAIFINDNSDGTVFNRGDAYSALGINRGRAQNYWFCESWSFTPSPDAGKQDGGGSLCSYVEIYHLKIEDLTINTLSLRNNEDSVLNLGMLLRDNSGDGIGLDVNLGIYDWQCGPFNVPTGQTDNDAVFDGDALCDLVTTGGCDHQRHVVRLPWRNQPSNQGSGGSSGERAAIASQVNNNHWCTTEGGTKALGLVDLNNIYVRDNNTTTNGGVKASISGGSLNFSLKSGFSLGLSGSAALSGITLGIIDLGGLISALLPILEGLFVNITEGVIQNSLKDFDLDFLFTTLLGSKFELNTQAWEVHSICTLPNGSKQTCSGSTTNAVDVNWSWLYRGSVKTTQAQAGVNQVLGSKFIEDSVNNPIDNPTSTTDNFSIVINQNIINQALASFYNVGLTHFAFFIPLGVAEVGPGTTDDWGADGDQRLLLEPKSPPTFDMRSGSGSALGTMQATLSYTGASMLMQTKSGSNWNTDMTIDVDIEAGVLMRLNEQKLEITMLGTPNLVINKIDLPDNFAFIEPLVQPVVDIAANLFVPAITDTFLEIDMSSLETGDLVELSDPTKKLVISTEGLEANNGAHLGFSTGINLGDK